MEHPGLSLHFGNITLQSSRNFCRVTGFNSVVVVVVVVGVVLMLYE
jgi:hypothetical protein